MVHERRCPRRQLLCTEVRDGCLVDDGSAATYIVADRLLCLLLTM
jgi:hypothetical protein